MAQIESTAIGAGRKSIGNITYRYVKGKTIASRRITQNNSRTPLQMQQRYGFTATVQLAKALNPVIRIGFEKNKTGSPYNQFMKQNKSYLNYAKTSPRHDIELPAITNLCTALADETFNGKITVANGSLNQTTLFKQETNAKLTGTIYLSRDFNPGDKIHLITCYSYQLVGSHFEAVKIYTNELTIHETDRLNIKNQYPINEETFPALKLFDGLPEEATNIETALATIITGETDHTTTTIQPLPADDEDPEGI